MPERLEFFKLLEDEDADWPGCLQRFAGFPMPPSRPQKSMNHDHLVGWITDKNVPRTIGGCTCCCSGLRQRKGPAGCWKS